MRWIVAFAFGVTIATASHAQTPEGPVGYPNRPVKVVVGYAAGGPTDVIARFIAQKLSQSMGQNFYVENITAAGGAVGAANVANSPPDGHTIMFVTNDFAIAPVTSKAPYSVDALVPVTIAAATPQAVAVNIDVPARTMKELDAVVRPSQEKYSYSSISGVGLSLLSSVRLFRLGMGLDKVVRVPFPGAAPAIASTLAMHTQLTFVGLAPIAPHVKEGKLRLLAVTSPKRSPAFPDVPTLAEAGYPNQESELVIGLIAPRGTPKPIIDTLQQQVAKIVVMPDIKDKLDVLGFYPVGSSSQEYARYVKNDIEVWSKVARATGIPD
jgi:tripartite-type tricarboxylate transporter receptor subunit TctC